MDRAYFDTIAIGASLTVGADGQCSRCPTGEPYFLLCVPPHQEGEETLSVGEPTEANAWAKYELQFRHYVDHASKFGGAIYWRSAPKAKQRPNNSWGIYSRLIISDRSPIDGWTPA